jgi:hypothetical protein
MRKNPTETFPLSLQQLFYAITIHGHVTKKQGQDFMDTSGVHPANPQTQTQQNNGEINQPTMSFSGRHRAIRHTKALMPTIIVCIPHNLF